MRPRLMIVAAIVVALAVAATAAVVFLRSSHGDADRSRLATALRLAPPGTQRFSWTDWTGVRRQVGLDLTAASPGSAVDDLLDRGFEADLTPSSALGSSAVVMQEQFGFSPATLDWELFNQELGLASLTMHAGPDVDFDVVASSLSRAGYEDAADDTWVSDPETDAITSQVTPELIFIHLDPEASMIFASDTSAGLDAATGAADSADSEPLPAGVVGAAGSPLAASLYSGDQVCSALALARADETDVAAGKALIAAAGEVNPITGFSIGQDADGSVRVVMSFANEEQARTNAETRAVLATGPAPGQGGDFADRFTLRSATASGDVVRLELAPTPGAYVLSDLSSGPVLFATC